MYLLIIVKKDKLSPKNMSEEFAQVETGKRAEADPPNPIPPCPPGLTQPNATTFPVSTPAQGVAGSSDVEDKLALYYEPCPQGEDCAGDGKHRRLFVCGQCGFRGCAACMEIHESEPHTSDSATMLEMFRNIRS